MADICKGELQDNLSNTLYPHTTSDIVFCTDGETVQDKLTRYEDSLGSVTGKTDSLGVNDSNILATSKAVNNLKKDVENSLENLSDSLSDMIKVFVGKNTSKITVSRDKSETINFTVSEPTGYTRLGIISVNVSNSNLSISAFGIGSTGGSNLGVTVHNFSSADQTVDAGKAFIGVLYVKK